MMRLLSIVVLCLPLLARGAGPDDFAAAEEAYKAGAFDRAAALYSKAIEDGWVAPELFYNLGNALFKQDRIGEAVKRAPRQRSDGGRNQSLLPEATDGVEP